MKPPPFEYFAPTKLPEAVALLSASENARLLAGGQSLMAMLNMRYVFQYRVVDLNRVAELDFIEDTARWGYKFRFGVFRIDDHDLEVIRSAMVTPRDEAPAL